MDDPLHEQFTTARPNRCVKSPIYGLKSENALSFQQVARGHAIAPSASQLQEETT
jgi:hypothetical protein